jgi:hypothetical protein
MITLTSEHVVSGETYELITNGACAIKTIGEQKVLMLANGSEVVLTSAGYTHLIEEMGA